MVYDNNTYPGVVYFMCQATGYKQTSNKELPGTSQAFSKVLPTTKFSDGKDTASVEQQLPMFGVIEIGTTYDIQLIRIKGIQTNKAVALYTDKYSTEPMKLEYLKVVSNSQDPIEARFGQWTETVSKTIQI
jgi:hypothetical protein